MNASNSITTEYATIGMFIVSFLESVHNLRCNRCSLVRPISSANWQTLDAESAGFYKSIELKENNTWQLTTIEVQWHRITREFKGDNLRRCIENNADYSFEFEDQSKLI